METRSINGTASCSYEMAVLRTAATKDLRIDSLAWRFLLRPHSFAAAGNSAPSLWLPQLGWRFTHNVGIGIARLRGIIELAQTRPA